MIYAFKALCVCFYFVSIADLCLVSTLGAFFRRKIMDLHCIDMGCVEKPRKEIFVEKEHSPKDSIMSASKPVKVFLIFNFLVRFCFLN